MAVIIEEEIGKALEPARGDTLALDEILSGKNLADMISDAMLGRIGQRVIRDMEIDETSRDEWLERYKRCLDIAMQVREAKSFPWAKSSNVKYPLLTTAAVQFQARAYPAIVDGSNLVKGRVLGPDPSGEKRSRADRIGQHMTWQLLFRMPGWEEDTDRLLLMLPIVGCVFRKTYYDPIENANRSEMVSGEDFIVNYWAKSLETAPRFTHVLHYYPYEVQELIAAGVWRDIALDDSDGADEQALGDYYEQHCAIDIDGDGYPEPYVVTCNKDGQIARITPCFGIEDITVVSGGQTMKAVKALDAGVKIERVVKIERRRYFTKYGFIPAPDGSFYDMGFGTLLDDISSVVDTMLNQMIDAGALQNAGGGFIGSGVQIKGGNLKFTLGEFKRVDVTGGILRDNILPMPAPGPSAVLFNLLGMLIDAAKEITSVQDVLTGEGTANQPATTTLALIEQGQKVMTGIFKRIHRAFGQELRVLRRLNRDYLDEEEYFQLGDEEAVQIGRADYEDEDLDVIPVSDPNQVSDMQKITRATALMQTFNGDPMINQVKLRETTLEALGVRDVKGWLDVPEPQPDPKMLAETAKIELADQDAETRRIAAKAGASRNFMAAAKDAAELGLLNDAQTLAAKAADEAEVDNELDEGQGGLSGMEGPASDEGLSGALGGAEAGLDGGMGPGVVDDSGTAGAGGLAGPVVEPEL